jgi:hypothetical protein
MQRKHEIVTSTIHSQLFYRSSRLEDWSGFFDIYDFSDNMAARLGTPAP